MTTTNIYSRSPKESLKKQHAEILKAIELLQKDAEGLQTLINNTDESEKKWSVVGNFAKTAVMSRELIETYEEE